MNIFGRKAPIESPAGIRVMLELWPDKMLGRATVERDGKPRMLEISAPYVRIVLQFLRAMGVEL